MGCILSLYCRVDVDGKRNKVVHVASKKAFEYYDGLRYSFNVPDFVRQPVDINHMEVRELVNLGTRKIECQKELVILFFPVFIEKAVQVRI